MTELEKIDRDIDGVEESRKVAFQKLAAPLTEEERAVEHASIRAYQQDLTALEERRRQIVKVATEASA